MAAHLGHQRVMALSSTYDSSRLRSYFASSPASPASSRRTCRASGLRLQGSSPNPETLAPPGPSTAFCSAAVPHTRATTAGADTSLICKQRRLHHSSHYGLPSVAGNNIVPAYVRHAEPLEQASTCLEGRASCQLSARQQTARWYHLRFLRV